MGGGLPESLTGIVQDNLIIQNSENKKNLCFKKIEFKNGEKRELKIDFVANAWLMRQGGVYLLVTLVMDSKFKT